MASQCTSFFFPRSIIPTLFRRSECRCTVTVTSKRAVQAPQLTMPRLLVTAPSKPPPAFLDSLRPMVVVVVILSRPFFFTRYSLYPRHGFPPPPPPPYHAAATRRVSLTSSTSLSWVRGCVCNARNVLLGPTATIDNAVTIAEDTHAPVPLC